jgi:hypothetical protein
MARRNVIEVKCDRCSRKETQDSDEIPKEQGPEFEAAFHGEKIVFNDLCRRCREAVKGYFSRVVKKVDDQVEKTVSTPSLDLALEDKQEDIKKKGFFGK